MTMLRHFRCSSANTAEHDRHGDERRARHDDERHVDEKLSAIAISNTACHILPVPQQHDDGIGERDRAQREFLALVDVVLDEDAIARRRRA